MVHKSIVVGLVVLLVAAVSTFVGVFCGLGSRRSSNDHSYSRAAVAADAGQCSEIGRLEFSLTHKHKHTVHVHTVLVSNVCTPVKLLIEMLL